MIRAALLIAVVAAGCAEKEVAYLTTVVPLDRPARPVLPTVRRSELECIGDDAYQRLIERQSLISGYAKELEAIVDSTKPKQPLDKTDKPDEK